MRVVSTKAGCLGGLFLRITLTNRYKIDAKSRLNVDYFDSNMTNCGLLFQQWYNVGYIIVELLLVCMDNFNGHIIINPLPYKSGSIQITRTLQGINNIYRNISTFACKVLAWNNKYNYCEILLLNWRHPSFLFAHILDYLQSTTANTSFKCLVFHDLLISNAESFKTFHWNESTADYYVCNVSAKL